MFSRYLFEATAGGRFVSLAGASGENPANVGHRWRAGGTIDSLAQFNRSVDEEAGGKAGGGKIASANEPSLMIKTGDLAGRSASGDPTGLVKKLAASSLPF